MGKLISISGTHCSGKTTLLKELETSYSVNRKDEDFKVLFVDSVTRSLKKKGYPINNEESSNYDGTQIACLKQDLRNIQTAFLLDGTYIFDRSLLDTFVYTTYLFRQKKVSTEAYEEIKSRWEGNKNSFDVIFLLNHTEIPFDNDGVRSPNLLFREEIALIFKEILGESNIVLEIVSGSKEIRLLTVIKKIWKINQ